MHAYSIIQPGTLPPGPGNLALDPLFLDTTTGDVHGVTVDQVCIAFPKYKLLFIDTPRGVLVDNPAGLATFELARKLGCHSFTLFYNLEDETFFCVTRGPGKPDSCFTTGKVLPAYEPIDSILGETTLEGVMRVLSIPRRLLLPENSV